MLGTLLCGGALALTACPWLTEVHADAASLPDSAGEFLEIAFPDLAVPGDSALITLEGMLLGKALGGPGQRIVFCHRDSLAIFPDYPVPCLPLLVNLPNSKAMEVVMQSGICRDTAWLESARSGKSWQRSGNPSEARWELSPPSPGFASPELEPGGVNLQPHWAACSLQEAGWVLRFYVGGNAQQEGEWHWNLQWYSFRSPQERHEQDGVARPGDTVNIRQPPQMDPWVRVVLNLQGDSYPLDNRVENLLFPHGSPPLRISEVAADPLDSWPEWIEIENTSPYPLPLSAISACQAMEAPDPGSYLAPGHHALLTDSRIQLLEAAPGLLQTAILETTRAWSLGNRSDTVRICLWDQQVDSLFWNPQNPLPHKPTTPGWVPAEGASQNSPRLSGRILSRSKKPRALWIQFPSTGSNWKVSIWDKHGEGVLPPQLVFHSQWHWEPPAYLPLGIYQIVLQSADGTRLQKGVALVP